GRPAPLLRADDPRLEEIDHSDDRRGGDRRAERLPRSCGKTSAPRRGPGSAGPAPPGDVPEGPLGHPAVRWEVRFDRFHPPIRPRARAGMTNKQPQCESVDFWRRWKRRWTVYRT